MLAVCVVFTSSRLIDFSTDEEARRRGRTRAPAPLVGREGKQVVESAGQKPGQKLVKYKWSNSQVVETAGPTRGGVGAGVRMGMRASAGGPVAGRRRGDRARAAQAPFPWPTGKGVTGRKGRSGLERPDAALAPSMTGDDWSCVCVCVCCACACVRACVRACVCVRARVRLVRGGSTRPPQRV